MSGTESTVAEAERPSAPSDFLAIAVHELKSPLATLALQLSNIRECLAQKDVERAAVDLSLGRAQRQVGRLATMIDEMREMSLGVAGNVDTQREASDLSTLVRDVTLRFELQARSANSPLRYHSDGPVPGHWDSVRIDQVVGNLLSNALKFGAARPIDVVVSSNQTQARIVVRDQGIGIPRHEHVRIFGRFFRGGAASGYRGSGIGLWMVRQIVHALGGLVWVDSDLGSGATFTVELPRV